MVAAFRVSIAKNIHWVTMMNCKFSLLAGDSLSCMQSVCILSCSYACLVFAISSFGKKTQHLQTFEETRLRSILTETYL